MQTVGPLVLMLALAWGASRAAAQPAEPEPRSPHDRGRISLGLAGGTQDSFADPGDRHIYLGGSFGYYVLTGLELGVGGIVLFTTDPGVAMVSPRVRYVFHQVPGSFKPYLGTFHTHWFIGSEIDDVDTVGARAGLLTRTGNLLIGLGVAYETVVTECTGDCDLVYPELTFAVAF